MSSAQQLAGDVRPDEAATPDEQDAPHWLVILPASGRSMPPAASLRPHAGNAYDKYGTRNPVARALTTRFLSALDDLWEAAAPESVLDVGCGEGVVAERWARRLGERGSVLGLDRGHAELEEAWRTRRAANLDFAAGDATALPCEDGSFDLVAGVELLEQVADAERALAEMARVARRHVLVSVPREPLWRVLNVARGAYVRWLGNPPGHVRHFSRRGFVRLAARHGEVELVRSPLPWTLVLLRVGD
jgi:SAM-dependent methyltransferase